MIEIIPAQTGDSLEHMITLSQEYVTWMLGEVRTRYPDLDAQEFSSKRTYDDIRKKFPGEHVPPDGCLLIARNDGQVSGCIALARLSGDIAEMRTLYVRPSFRGTGAGKKLVETLLDQARTLGYKRVRLDTLRFMESAQTLYRSYGFYDIEPYREMSPSMGHYICFFECNMDARTS
jgi:GNAT superfamily N-acetyltransferase